MFQSQITNDFNEDDSAFIEVLDSAVEFVNPYVCDRELVKTAHFRDARLYDSELNNEGWQVPRYVAKKKYKQWLSAVRKTPGWKDFRRPVMEIEETVEDDEGNVFTQKRVVVKREYSDRPKSNRRKLHNQISETVVDDENFKPKMFTTKMGSEIAKQRTKLGMNQAQLAKKLNVDYSFIRNLEQGGNIVYHPEDPFVKDLSRALGLSGIKYME